MIRLTQTADGWTVEITGEREVAVPEPETDEALRDGIARLRDKQNVAAGMVRAVLTEQAVADAVAQERARCLAWVECYLDGPISCNWTDVRDAVRDGTAAPDGKAG